MMTRVINMVMGIIRLKGTIRSNKKIENTLRYMNLKSKNTLVILESPNKTLLNKVQAFATWGKINDDVVKELKNKYGEGNVFALNPPKRGFRSLKMMYSKGDLGQREDVTELVKRMMR